MPGSFSRSTKILESDSVIRFALAILLIAPFLLLWSAWFLFARVPVYEVTNAAEMLNSTRVVAQLPSSALLSVQPGQPAQLFLDDFHWAEHGTVATTVSYVDGAIRDGRIRVELRVQPDQQIIVPLQRGLTGRIEVEVERVSPVTLLLRSAGMQMTGSLDAVRDESKVSP